MRAAERVERDHLVAEQPEPQKKQPRGNARESQPEDHPEGNEIRLVARLEVLK